MYICFPVQCLVEIHPLILVYSPFLMGLDFLFKTIFRHLESDNCPPIKLTYHLEKTRKGRFEVNS